VTPPPTVTPTEPGLPLEPEAPAEPAPEPTDEEKKATEAAKVLAERSKESRFAKRREELQGEIDSLTRKKYDTLREIEDLERRKSITPAPALVPPTTPLAPVGATYKEQVEHYKHDPAFPKAEEFDTYEDFSAAQAAFVADKQYEVRRAADQKAEQDRQAAAQAQAAEQARQAALNAHVRRVEHFIAEHPDYDEVIRADGAVVTQEMAQVLIESEIGPAIAYYLGQHPDESKKLAELRGVAAFRAMGKLEAKLEGPAVAAPTSVPASSAPAPVAPVRGITVPSAVASPDGDFNAYVRWREQQMAAKRRIR